MIIMFFIYVRSFNHFIVHAVHFDVNDDDDVDVCTNEWMNEWMWLCVSVFFWMGVWGLLFVSIEFLQ